MDFGRLVELTADLHCFSPGMITAGEDLKMVRVQLSRWVQSGRLVRIHKGWYTLTERFRNVRLDMNVIASTIKSASYVSLQSALSFHGMIPEYVPETTCITTGRPLRIQSPFGRISFRHIKPEAFWGYSEDVVSNQSAYVAKPEKALLDLLYLTPGSVDLAYIKELRLQNVEVIDRIRLINAAEAFGAPRMIRAVRLIESVIDQLL